jgi:putative oxidoreductase
VTDVVRREVKEEPQAGDTNGVQHPSRPPGALKFATTVKQLTFTKKQRKITMQTSFNNFYRIGRAFIGILFLCAGIIKITHFQMFLDYMAGGGLPLVSVLLPLTILMEVGCGLMLISGWKSVYAAVILALFTIPTTFIFHAFWSADAASVLNQLTSFLKNVAMFGGLLMVIGYERANAGKASA